MLILKNSFGQILKNSLGQILFKGTLPQLDTPENISTTGTSISWDSVMNATDYDIYVDGVLYGSYPQGAVVSGEKLVLSSGASVSSQKLTLSMGTVAGDKLYL